MEGTTTLYGSEVGVSAALKRALIEGVYAVPNCTIAAAVLTSQAPGLEQVPTTAGCIVDDQPGFILDLGLVPPEVMSWDDDNALHADLMVGTSRYSVIIPMHAIRVLRLLAGDVNLRVDDHAPLPQAPTPVDPSPTRFGLRVVK